MRALSYVCVMVFLQGLFVSSVEGQDCEVTNDALVAMTKSEVSVTKKNGEIHTFVVKTAENNHTRAAGFQRVCAETIASEPILFVFERVFVPSFHMNNVVAPIDIAFIDEHGRIESIQAMQPYVLISRHKPLYSPETPVNAALEARPGFYSDHGIEVGALVVWEDASE